MILTKESKSGLFVLGAEDLGQEGFGAIRFGVAQRF